MRGRGLIIAAPASGSGKTLVTFGLLRHLAQSGIAAAAAKTGPDYIDPGFHTLASGAPCLNLDPWAMRPETLASHVAQLEQTAEIVLCEGVMGLFDGTGTEGETGSTAELARLTGWPVVLIVDARGQGASAAALLRGFVAHDPEVPIAGVVFNRVAGARHSALLAAAVARHLPGLCVLGAVPMEAGLTLPSRHLGLVPAGEIAAAEVLIARAAAIAGASLDIARLLSLAQRSRHAGAPPQATIPPLGTRIAVARDAAFGFAYPALFDGWRRSGVEIVFFSPLANEPPDPAADAVYLPGGYPELSAGRLAAAETCFAGLRRAAQAGKAIYGECGGYMALGRALVDAEGCRHAMAGLLPLETSFAEPRRHLGYRAVRLLAGGPLGPAGTGFRGHEFHYASIVAEGGFAPLFAAADSCGHDLGACGLRQGLVCGSFIHLIDRC
ncbi:MAG: cobyrinate a,c-diamide synthase [Stellaceae bacterium]